MTSKAKATKPAPAPELDPVAQELASDEAPADLTAELDAVELPGDDGADPGAPPAPVEPPAPPLRPQIRGAWQGLAGMLELYYGPELHHTPAELDALTDCWLPVAEVFGTDWLGDWVLVVGAIGVTIAVEAPKLRRAATTSRENVELNAGDPDQEDDDRTPAEPTRPAERATPGAPTGSAELDARRPDPVMTRGDA